MRKIKFRAWDDKNKKLTYLDDLIIFWKTCPADQSKPYKNIEAINLCSKNRIEMPAHPDDQAIWYEDYQDKEKHFTIEQYTGLKDKNGKEIYEGDIDIGRWFDGVDWYTTKGVVIFKNGSFLVDDNKRTKLMIVANLENKIIGNIHENPELLND